MIKMSKIRAFLNVFAGICLHLTFGIMFTWGNLSRYLISYMHNKGHGTTMDDSAWGFALGIIGLGASMWSGSIIEKKLGPKWPCVIGSIIMTSSMFLTYFICQWYIPTIIVYGFLVAFGAGIAYSVPMSVAMRWLPNAKGAVNGCVVAGFGGSAFIFNQIQTNYINPNGIKLAEGASYYTEEVTDRVPNIFLIMGGIFAGLQLIGCLIIENPPNWDTGKSIKKRLLQNRNEENEGNSDRKYTDEFVYSPSIIILYYI